MKWIDLSKQKPEAGIKIKLARFDVTDCGKVVVWESIGWMLKSGVFSVKWVLGLTYENSKPTHWCL